MDEPNVIETPQLPPEPEAEPVVTGDDYGQPPAAPAVPAVEPVIEPAEPAPAEPRVPVSALQKERAKVKAAKRATEMAGARVRELEDLRRQSAGPQARQVDYDTLGSYRELASTLNEQWETRDAVTRAALSQRIAELQFDDYDEVLEETKILDDITRDPVLAKYIAGQLLPAVALYELALSRLAPKMEAKGRQEGAKAVVQKVIRNAEAPRTLANTPAAAASPPPSLTREKAVDLSDAEWAALPEATRQRLLGAQ